MTLNEKIEANADKVLWCVHTLGVDDVTAAPSHLAAATAAHELNKSIFGRTSNASSVLCFSYAAPWPHSAEGHAESVKNWGQE